MLAIVPGEHIPAISLHLALTHQVETRKSMSRDVAGWLSRGPSSWDMDWQRPFLLNLLYESMQCEMCEKASFAEETQDVRIS